MSAYLVYAASVRTEIARLLEETGLRVRPASGFVSCGRRPEHLVPLASLERHARVVHGERHVLAASHRFFYGQNDVKSDEKQLASDDFNALSITDDPMASLVEVGEGDTAQDETQDDIRAHLTTAIEQIASSDGLSGFYAAVRQWRVIPRVFARLPLDSNVVDPDKLRRWLTAELTQHLIEDTETDEASVDAELVDYVVGLLEHPEFSHPDLLLLEMQEFLGSSTRAFVLALWKFLVVEVALKLVYRQDGANTALLHTLSTPVSMEVAKTTPTAAIDQPPPPVRKYKRRRPSYRRRGANSNPYDGLRELLASQMAELSAESGRELVEDPTTVQREDSENKRKDDTHKQIWTECTDALKPPGGGSSIGSLIFGGDSNNNNSSDSYLDERRTRRIHGKSQETPESNPIVDKHSFYGTPTAVQQERERVTMAPGAVSRDALVMVSQGSMRQQQRSTAATADYFAGGMGANEAEQDKTRRTRRMYGPPGGASSFQLG
ncbi:hypothetical protein Poli38472_013493 [Pythium oligandrum]|uniref:PWI domain-containing protein n=1 Tax=Pythium oligandrum TaxID=41045 RepID=A0A8K1FEJ9_PYTOL|nr:hypothetical protein Poli38472_013493 [Pythium oligandrum]|eukprot:TMW58019.1 hypothetical protein Poli38472_013493 [Pythium oligandrum]